MITFYHRFVPAAASILEPLFKLLAGENKELSWDSAASFAFENAKEALAKANNVSTSETRRSYGSHGQRIGNRGRRSAGSTDRW